MKKPRANKEVWVSVGMTLNLGSYESARVDAGITVPVGTFDTEEDAFEHGWATVLAEVKSKAKSIKDENIQKKNDSNDSKPTF